MNIRTDLISEIREMHTEEIEGAVSREYMSDGIEITEVAIRSESAARKLEKPIGKYFTLKFGEVENMTDTAPLENAIVNALGSLFKNSASDVMVVGLGNTDITPDALGPFVADRILATRHISERLSEILEVESLSKVSAITTNVLGKTGIESAEIIKATADKIRPDAIIAVDALAARRPERLCRTIQLSNTGITPGSGVHNARARLDEDNLGIPVIAIGMPTVIEAATYRYDMSGKGGDEKMMVTPKDIDRQIKKSADIISGAINRFLQPNLDPAVINALM